MKKYTNLILLGTLCPTLPIVLGSLLALPHNTFSDQISMVIMFLYFVYMPIFSGVFGLRTYYKTHKYFIPQIIYSAFLLLVIGTASLADSLINGNSRVLMIISTMKIPLIYSLPLAPLSSAIRYYKDNADK